MDSQIDFWTARTLLEWQVELGVTEAISETPVDRFALDVKPPAQKPTQPAPVAPVVAPDIDPVAIAKASAANATSLEALKSAVAGFPHCELQRGAHNLVFADGSPSARVMVIGEFPSREDDLQGLPFAGRAGALLDKMFAAIAMARSADGAAGVYLTTALPWRPPRNRDPKSEEIAMMRPFLERHITLAKPDLIVLMGGVACQALLGQRGMTRLRGQWKDVNGIPALPMNDPEYLLRNPHSKRDAWGHLLSLQARLREMS